MTSYGYDALGRLASRTDALGNMQSLAYDSLGNLVAVTDAKGKSYRYSYDELSRLVARINKAGAKQSYSYDPVGNLVSKTDFNGLVAQYQYDGAYRLSAVNFSDGKKKSYGYDPDGNLVAATNEADSLSFKYDPDNRLAGLTDGNLSQSESFANDPAGNRLATSWLDGKRTISYAYGKMNELLSVTDTARGKTSFGYDDLERVISELQPDGVATTTSYDAASRVTSIVYKEDHGWGDEKLVSRAYLYNDANEKTFKVDSNGHVTAYAYDADGRLSQVEYPFVEDKKSVDFKERLDLGLAPVFTTSKGRGGAPQVTGSGFPRGIDGFDPRGFAQDLSDLVAKDDGLYKALQKIDPKAQGSWTITSGAGATAFAQRLSPDGTTSQALQTVYQSVSGWARYFDPNEYVWTESYSYDQNGNRTAKANGWGSIPYSYSDDDRMLSAGNRTYTYDPNGTTTSESLGAVTTSYSYSDDNRLIDAYRSITADAGRAFNLTIRDGVSYTYDALGRRTERAQYGAVDQDWARHAEREWKTETDRDYLYDGMSLDPLAVFTDTDFSRTGWKDYDQWGRRGQNMAAVSELIRGNGKLLERNSFSDHSYGWNAWNPSDVDYYLTDKQGSVTNLVEKYGRIAEQYTYDAFGQAIAGELGAGNDIGYDGKVYDPMTKLYNYGYRDYSPRVGRFTTSDPIKAGSNWYVYCDNDPVNATDPAGLAQIYANDINGVPIVASPGRNLAKETSIVVTRANTELNEKVDTSGPYFQGTISVKIGKQTVFSSPAQTIPTRIDTNDANSGPLALGDYRVTVLPNDWAKMYSEALSISGNGININWGYLVHPDIITNPQSSLFGTLFSPPDTTGCIVVPGSNIINSIVGELSGVGIGAWQSVPMEIKSQCQ